jgi:bla regulator protein BlaR1
MMNMRFRPVELGLLAVLGLTGAAAPGLADPDRRAPAVEASDRDRAGRDLNYVFFYDENETTMSGNLKDIDRARKFKHPKEQLLWFREGGQEYLIRDPATLKQAEAAWKPVRELGEQQGKLGSQQGELGRQQGELGRQQGILGTRQGTLAVRESALSMRESSDALSPADKEQVARQRQELRQQQRALRKEMRALEKPMRELGDKMNVLGREMDALGRQMTAAAQKSEAEIRALFKRATSSGIARPAA